MSIFDKIKFTAKLKAQWRHAKAEQHFEDILEQASCEVDILKTPGYIIQNTIKSMKRIAVDGIKIGNSIDMLPKHKIKEITNSRWPKTSFYHCNNSVTYKVIAGTVVEFFLNNDLAQKTGLRNEQDVLHYFGKPDKIRKVRNGSVLLLKTYIYKKRHIEVEIDNSGYIIRINIS